MKVFISHQRQDSATATTLAHRLKYTHQIDFYLDVIDPAILRNGEDLADYIRVQMDKCTQLLAVVSYATKSSQWVPWEIGVASEKDFPLATFADAAGTVPEFIQRWPVLRTMTDLDQYASASIAASRTYSERRSYSYTEASSRKGATETFYSRLRANLR